MAVKFRIPLAAEQRSVAVQLQGTLVDLLDLTLIGKHVHWNVEGPLFRSVHHELDELVDTWRRLSDDVAKRAVTIGASPDRQVGTFAGSTQLEPVPPGHVRDRQALKAFGDRIADAVIRTRQRIDRVAVDDPITGDLLVHLAAALEQQLWMIRAQNPDSGRAARDADGILADDSNGTDRS
jgi:starvation-inducible DNA-binding protein